VFVPIILIAAELVFVVLILWLCREFLRSSAPGSRAGCWQPSLSPSGYVPRRSAGT
jgi:hypothetical protein